MRNIKYFYLLFIFLIFSPDLIYAQETIKSASEYDYPPFSIVTEKGEADGFSVELLRASLKAAGLDVKFYVGPWVKIKQDLTQGKIQVLPLVGRTPERETIYDFSVPYKISYGAIFVRADEASINILNDLADKEVLVMKGDNAEEFLVRENVSKYIITTESFEDAFKMLSEGKHDAVVALQTVGTQLIEKLGITNVIHKSRIDKYKQDWTFAVKEGDKQLLASLNDGLSKIIINGTFDRIHDKWFKRPNVDGKIKIKLTPKEKIFEKKVIELIALGIAKEIDDYLEKNPQKTIEDLQNDEYFKTIATQPVGETGYTAVVDSQSGEFYFHPREQFVGINLADFEEDFNDLWKILEATRGEQCTESSGYYGWKEVEGEVTKKYLNTACIKNAAADGKKLFIVASTYLTEIEGSKYLKKYDVIKTTFAEESIEQKAKDVAKQIEIYLRSNPDMTLKELQEDSYFRDIAVQPVGKTGYTAVNDYNTFFVKFHKDQSFVDLDLHTLADKLPDFWKIISKSEGGFESKGTYNWEETDGSIKRKYAYIANINIKTADGVGLHVAATTYLDEYEKIVEAKEPAQKNSMIWFVWALILVILVLFILDKLHIIKFEKNAIMLFLSIALLLIIGLFIFNAYNISKKMRETAIENYYDTLRATASTKHVNIEQHISHVKSSFKVVSSRKVILNEDLRKIVNFGEDFIEVFRTDSNGIITYSSDLSNIGLSRLEDTYFKNAKENIYIKPLYRSSTVGELLFTISTPYQEGVLVARMSLNHIHEIISKKEGLGKSGESLLAYRNKNGNAVFFTERRFTAEAEARDIIPKQDVNVPITQALLGNEKKFSNYVDYRNVPVFAVTKYIEGIDAGLVVKIDQEEVFESVSGNIKQIWYSTAVIVFAIIIIGMIFYFLLTKALRREVKNKTNDLEKASSGLSEKIALLLSSEKKLTLSEKRYRSLVETQTDLVSRFKPDGEFTFVNEVFCNFFNKTKKEILEGEWQPLPVKEDIDHVNSQLALLSKENPTVIIENRVYSDKGDITWMQFVNKGFFDNFGNLLEIQSVGRNITEQKKYEKLIKTSLQEKEILLKEIHHRVKNNMQIIQSLLSLQSNEMSDPEHKKSLIDSNNRIKSMALIHEILYRSENVAVLDLQTYFNEIVQHLLKIYQAQGLIVALNLDIDPVELDMDLSIACGLIINELVSNSLKYAFVSDSKGDLFISLKMITANEALMIVKDNGHGLPVDLDFNTNDSLGLKIVKILVEGQLKGSMKVKSDDGASFEINFPFSKG